MKTFSTTIKLTIIRDEYLLVVDENKFENKGPRYVIGNRLNDYVITSTSAPGRKIVGYYPLNGKPAIEGALLLPFLNVRPKVDVLKIADMVSSERHNAHSPNWEKHRSGVINGYHKCMEDRGFTEEDLREAVRLARLGKDVMNEGKPKWAYSKTEDQVIKDIKDMYGTLPIYFNGYVGEEGAKGVYRWEDRPIMTEKNGKGEDVWVGNWVKQ